MTINIHERLFVLNHLCYGLKLAPGFFQRTMENILQGIPNVIVRMDDILLTGLTRKAHLSTLEQVLCKLDTFDVHMKHRKCKFIVSGVNYLSHKVNRNGIQPADNK